MHLKGWKSHADLNKTLHINTLHGNNHKVLLPWLVTVLLFLLLSQLELFTTCPERGSVQQWGKAWTLEPSCTFLLSQVI